jgi:hypothetical protein
MEEEGMKDQRLGKLEGKGEKIKRKGRSWEEKNSRLKGVRG